MKIGYRNILDARVLLSLGMFPILSYEQKQILIYFQKWFYGESSGTLSEDR